MRKKYCSLILLPWLLSAGNVAANEEMLFVPVDPCRVADTRKSSEGVIRQDTFRNFKISGSAADLANQGGEVSCEHPRQSSDLEPLAVAAYVISVRAPSSSGNGALSAYPSDQDAPPRGSGSILNFTEVANIGNTTIARVCSGNQCPDAGTLAVLSRNSDRDVVIDVQGYFYSALDRGSCSQTDLAGTWTTYVAETLTASAACTLEVSETGDVLSGSCDGSDGMQSITGGTLAISQECAVSGSYFVDQRESEIQSATLSSDRNLLTGILTETSGNLTRLFTATRR
ncbi:hypothetical protein R0135_14220 [Congregibacter variabilis]|uniref:Uncharacterized protein n=1 Tax=Congregibacter variabilis TaxID=3081200 RepID=A0ABZ0I2C3_9GAMM|nr:hypothetical protein R0135_14220 [Congregibacter sp. IMCC43200]